MFCEHCGARLPDNARFCDRCGAPVAPAPAPTQPPTQPAPPPAPPKKSRKGLFIALAAGVVVILAVALLWGGKSGSRSAGDLRDVDWSSLNEENMSRGGEDIFNAPNVPDEADAADVLDVPDGWYGQESMGSVGGDWWEEDDTPAWEVVDSSSTLLPDPGLFLNCARGEDQASTSYGSDGWLVSYNFDLAEGEKAVEEFLALLEDDRYQLSLKTSTEDNYISSSSGSLYQCYYYTYNGTADVGTMYWEDISGNVYVLIGYYYDQGRIGMSVYYGAGFTLEDSGKHADHLPTDFNGSGGGSSSSSGSSGGDSSSSDWNTVPKIKCWKCHGEKKIDCTNCDGKGYKEVYVSSPNFSGSTYPNNSTVSRETCMKCHGAKKIDCTNCGGTGYT